MKKTIILFALTAVIASCKKKDDNSDFTPTDVTGTTVLKGNINKNVITPNGGGGYTNTSRIPAKGVTVSVKVNKNSLYPSSNAQGADVYTAVTDANGNYSVTVRANANGVPAQITIDGFTGTLDTIVNGQTRTGLYSSYQGSTFNRTLFMGQNSQLDYGFTASIVSSNPNTILKTGTAIITGSVGVSMFKEITSGTLVSITTTMVPVADYKVYLNFSNDPETLTTRSYEAKTDANGYYTFTVNTVAPGTPGFNQNAQIWVPDWSTTRDTIKANGTTKTGRSGVFVQQTLFDNSIYNSNIRNAKHLSYTAFIPN